MRLALAERIELLHGLFASLRVPGRDVNSCAVRNVSLGDHAADAFGAAGDQHHFALQDLD